MKPRDRGRHKGRRQISGWFYRVPTEVLNSAAYHSLSMKARALLLDIGFQFNGHNNGDFAIAWSVMGKRGWKSKDTLQRAIHELLDAGFIERTRQGGLHFASLYAVTWLPVDECSGKLDVPATAVASNRWRKPKDGERAAA